MMGKGEGMGMGRWNDQPQGLGRACSAMLVAVSATLAVMMSGEVIAAERRVQQVLLGKGWVALVLHEDVEAGSRGSHKVHPYRSVSDLSSEEVPAARLRRTRGDPASAVQKFLHAYQPLAGSGLPKPPQLATLANNLHPDLAQTLAITSSLQAASHCEGPPAIQGDLISSLSEGPNASEVLACRVWPSAASCRVRFTYHGTPEGVRWTDTIELRLYAERWLVHDVVPGAPWSARSRLSITLKEAVRVLRTCQ